ncbi:MAG: TlpA family protein disulfide reductase [Anaerolineales bacterium]|nr:TlpA family protein disulfide reductase [Anaerolineales bacterium]
MNSQTKRIFAYVFILALGAWRIIFSAPQSADESVAAPQAGFLAPNFILQTTEGKTYALADLRGQAVLVNIWATWCPPCKAEMPAIQKVYEEYAQRGLVVLAVNSAFQDDPAQIAPFREKYQLTFPILLDDAALVSRAYQARSLPSSYFIDRRGVISEVVVGGPMSEALLRARVEEILKP